MNRQLPTLILGTAQWGWTVSRDTAFQLLDAWFAAGFREIDAATNYPINRQPADFRASERILFEYLAANGITDAQVTMKIGSLNNMRTPEINLSPSFLLMMAGEYQRLLGSNLHGLMLHWDNRDEQDPIRPTLNALAICREEFGLKPGLSGIARPDLYAAANEGLGLDFDIEIKHNVFHSDYQRYASFPPERHRFLAYGLNAGGIKLEGPYPADSTLLARGGDPENLAGQIERLRALLPRLNTAFVRPPIRTMSHVGLINAGLHPGIGGIILGISSVAQLRESLDFWRNLEVFEYEDVWNILESFRVGAG